MRIQCVRLFFFFFFFNDTATTEIYTLSLHDALPISPNWVMRSAAISAWPCSSLSTPRKSKAMRSEEHTSELQSLAYLVCRLLLEKKKILPVLGRVCALHHSQNTC